MVSVPVMNSEQPIAVIVMGVTGSGKTTVGKRLAAKKGCAFFDGDDFHPAANVEKMRRGAALDDDDRAPWLDRLREVIANQLASGHSLVLACSALRETYRARLMPANAVVAGRVVFVYLRIAPETARNRLLARGDHFMPPTLIPSQFESLEDPESAIRVDAEAPVEDVVECIARQLADTDAGSL